MQLPSLRPPNIIVAVPLLPFSSAPLARRATDHRCSPQSSSAHPEGTSLRGILNFSVDLCRQQSLSPKKKPFKSSSCHRAVIIVTPPFHAPVTSTTNGTTQKQPGPGTPSLAHQPQADPCPLTLGPPHIPNTGSRATVAAGGSKILLTPLSFSLFSHPPVQPYEYDSCEATRCHSGRKSRKRVTSKQEQAGTGTDGEEAVARCWPFVSFCPIHPQASSGWFLNSRKPLDNNRLHRNPLYPRQGAGSWPNR